MAAILNLPIERRFGLRVAPKTDRNAPPIQMSQESADNPRAVFRLFAAWGATRTTLVAYLIPVWGIVLGYLVLQEPVDARIVIGTGLVIAGIGVVNSKFGRRRLFGRTAAEPVEAA